DGGHNHASAHPFQSVGIGVHRHDGLVLDAVVTEHGGHFLAALGFQAHEPVHLVAFFADNFGGAVKRNPRIALDVHHAHNFDLGSTFQCIAIAAWPPSTPGPLRHVHAPTMPLAVT